MGHPDDYEFTEAYEPDDEAGEEFAETLEADYQARLPGVRLLQDKGVDDGTIEKALGITIRPEHRRPSRRRGGIDGQALAADLDAFIAEHPEADYLGRLPTVRFLREQGLDDKTIEAALDIKLRPKDRAPKVWVQ
jgi:hypothetical protein